MSLAERGEAASKHWNKTMTTKTITAKIVVPEWAKWVATDSSGRVFVYRIKPVFMKHGFLSWMSNETSAGCRTGFLELYRTTPPRNWRKTLRRVK